MPKFDEQERVFALFSSAQTLSEELFLLIGKKNPQLVEDIADRYCKRAIVLDEIENWRREHATEFRHDDFQSKWQACAEKLESRDKQLMLEVPIMRKQLQQQLVDLNKRKYLLLYSRGHST